MLHFDLQLIFVSLLVAIVFAQNTTTPQAESTTTVPDFQCYHGESNGTKPMELMNCPTEVCIKYVTPCLNYWATTCYDDLKPMGISNAFKAVKDFKPSSFLVCRSSQCNTENFITAGCSDNIIHKFPKLFDNLLWPNLGKEKRSKILENQIWLSNLKYNYSTNESLYEFLGQTYKNSKKVWIEISTIDSKSNGLKLRLIFDLKKSMVTFKKSSYIPNISGKMELKEKLIPGQIINVTFSGSYNIDYTLWINGEKINWLPKNFWLLSSDAYINYGGDWSNINKREYFNEFNERVSPAFPFPRPSDSSKIDCDEDFLQHFKPITKLNYTIIDLTNKTFTYYLISNVTNLIPYEIKEFDLRRTLCPQNDLLRRYQIEPYLNGSNIYFNFFEFGPFGFNSFGMRDYSISTFEFAKNCDGISLTYSNSTNYCFDISCEIFSQGSSTILSRSCVQADSKKPMYLVEGPKRTFKC